MTAGMDRLENESDASADVRLEIWLEPAIIRLAWCCEMLYFLTILLLLRARRVKLLVSVRKVEC